MIETAKPWTEQDKVKWLEAQNAKPRIRSYYNDVLQPLESLSTQNDHNIHIIDYGLLSYGESTYPLKMIQIGQWDNDRPSVFIQGGTHGYEPSGVTASLQFAQNAYQYARHFNIMILPCTSPWSYETDNRWNPDARDPNRAFIEDSYVPEANILMRFMHENYQHAMDQGFLAHFSLHEALVERDEILERRKAERDGTVFNDPIPIPDGFFLISDISKNDPATEKAIIDGVRKVTHIAPTDGNGKVYGQPIQQEGVIYADIKGADVLFTNPQYAFTIEVTPESKGIKDTQEIIDAHIAAVESGLRHLIEN